MSGGDLGISILQEKKRINIFLLVRKVIPVPTKRKRYMQASMHTCVRAHTQNGLCSVYT
jgi:hypothetical protein